MLQAKHSDYDGAFLLAAATEQCHRWKKWKVDSAQLCQAFEKRGKRLHGKKQVATLALRKSTGGIFYKFRHGEALQGE